VCTCFPLVSSRQFNPTGGSTCEIDQLWLVHGLLIVSQYDAVACSNYFDAPFRNDKIELVILIT
jgi:hypothetical protein